MKIFFVALILGIFIGVMITARIDSPEAFESLFPSSSESADKKSTKKDVPKQKKPKVEPEKPADEKEKTNLKERANEGAKAVAEKSKEIFDSTKDLGIGTTIRGKFKLDKSIDPSRIKIDVENGSVTLSGEVSSRAEERKARDIALDTRGVKDVSSKLTIEAKP
ncbi:MAG: BON domain-containing protein [Opitutaceae bacterium]|nr:BON domain-containing protein [Opitutaceae bacterium]